jgi:hypothetical protein
MSKHPDSEKLILFRNRKTGHHLPHLGEEINKEPVDAVDPGLGSEDQRFIRHYLGYADILLRSPRAKLMETHPRDKNRKKQKAA